MELIVRNYREDDFETISHLWEETGMGGIHRGDTQDVILQTILQGGKLIILENRSTGEILGTSWLTQDGRRIYLHHFCIKPQYQGRGLSHSLMKESLQFARESKLQVKLEVHRSNDRAITLYKKHGFKELGDYQVFIIRKFEN